MNMSHHAFLSVIGSTNQAIQILRLFSVPVVKVRQNNSTEVINNLVETWRRQRGPQRHSIHQAAGGRAVGRCTLSRQKKTFGAESTHDFYQPKLRQTRVKKLKQTYLIIKSS